MIRLASMGALAAVLMLSAQPCLAAGDFGNRDLGPRSTAAFAGANFKVSFGQRNQPKPEARLQLGMRQSFAGSPSATRQVGMLELGPGKTGKPAFYMAGQDLGEMERQLGVKGTAGTLLLAAGGVLLAAVAVAALAGGSGEKCLEQTYYFPEFDRYETWCGLTFIRSTPANS